MMLWLGPTMCSLDQAIQFKDIESLKPGWNGNNAEVPPAAAIEIAKDIVNKIGDARLEVFPTAALSVQVECESDTGDYLEAEIYGPGDIHLFMIFEDGSTSEGFVDEEGCIARFQEFLGSLK